MLSVEIENQYHHILAIKSRKTAQINSRKMQHYQKFSLDTHATGGAMPGAALFLFKRRLANV